MTPQQPPLPPPIRVEVPGVGVVEFPASMSMAQITSEASRLTLAGPPKAKPAPSPGDWDEFAVLGNAIAGAAKEVGRQSVRGGEWLRQNVPGVAWLDEKVGHVDLPVNLAPTNDAQQFGGQALQLAQYVKPSMATARIVGGALAKAPAIVRGLGQMAGQAGAAAPVAALQGTDPATAATVAAFAPPVIRGTVGAVRGAARIATGAAQGAKEGGLGGAIVGAFRNVAPLPAKSLFTRAIKPRSTAVGGWDKALDTAMPELKAAEAEIGRPIAGISDLMAAIKSAKARLWSQYETLRPGYVVEVDLSRVADAAKRSIPNKLRIENPGLAERLEQQADGYRRTFKLPEAERLLLETNAELESFYAKYPQAQRHALLSDPEVARLEAQAKELRSAIYGVLDSAGDGVAARELKRRYGALLSVEDSAYRRWLVAARQQPESLSEQIGAVRAAGEYAKGAWRLAHGDPSGAGNMAAAYAGRDAARFLKEQQTTDALIRRTFEMFKGQPTPVPMPPATEIRGLLQAGARPMGAPATGPDPSFVRGVPAQYGQRVVRGELPQGQTPRGLLPAGDTVNVLPSSGQVMDIPHNLPPDPSGVRSVEGRFGYPSPIVTPAPVQPAGLLPERTATTPRRYPQSGIGGNQPQGPFNLPPGDTPTAPAPVRAVEAVPAAPTEAPGASGKVVPFVRPTPPQLTRSQQQVLASMKGVDDRGRIEAALAEMQAAVPLERGAYAQTVRTMSDAALRAEATAQQADPTALALVVREIGQREAVRAAKPAARLLPWLLEHDGTPAQRVTAVVAQLQQATEPAASVLLKQAQAFQRRIGPDRANVAQFPTASPATGPRYAPALTVKPAAVKPAPASAKTDTPAQAAEKVSAEVERVIDMSGEKTASGVHMRVIRTLQEELRSLEQTGAHGYKSIEWRPGKAYGGKEGTIWIDGEPALRVDRYGHTKWMDESSAYTTQQGQRVNAVPSSRQNVEGVNSDMPAGERGRILTARVAKAIGKGGSLRVQIPGDGTFTVSRNPEAIAELMARIKRSGPSMWGGIGQAPYAKTKPEVPWKKNW